MQKLPSQVLKQQALFLPFCLLTAFIVFIPIPPQGLKMSIYIDQSTIFLYTLKYTNRKQTLFYCFFGRKVKKHSIVDKVYQNNNNISVCTVIILIIIKKDHRYHKVVLKFRFVILAQRFFARFKIMSIALRCHCAISVRA